MVMMVNGVSAVYGVAVVHNKSASCWTGREARHVVHIAQGMTYLTWVLTVLLAYVAATVCMITVIAAPCCIIAYKTPLFTGFASRDGFAFQLAYLKMYTPDMPLTIR